MLIGYINSQGGIYMLKDFDIAFTNKVLGWYSNTIYANTAIIYNVAFNLVDDPTTVLTFPMIGIYRPTGFEINKNQSFAARKRGIDYSYNEDDKEFSFARFISVTLSYQLDIYAKSPEDLDDITENIIQSFNLFQEIEVTQVDPVTDINYTESYVITHTAGPAELSEFQNGDRIYHYSLVYDIQNARLVTSRQVKEINTVEATEAIDDKDLEGVTFDIPGEA
jgi:hypothetical protein